jgi:hypothetical protein
VKNFLFFVCLGIGVYQVCGYLSERKAQRAYNAFIASEPKNRAASQAGFTDAIALDGVDPTVMTVMMPCGCPLEAGRRGQALVDKMKAAGIPVTASSSAHVTLKGNSREDLEAQMALANKIMNGETPIVFYRGRAKNNPSFDDVALEYRTAQ